MLVSFFFKKNLYLEFIFSFLNNFGVFGSAYTFSIATMGSLVKLLFYSMHHHISITGEKSSCYHFLLIY